MPAPRASSRRPLAWATMKRLRRLLDQAAPAIAAPAGPPPGGAHPSLDEGPELVHLDVESPRSWTSAAERPGVRGGERKPTADRLVLVPVTPRPPEAAPAHHHQRRGRSPQAASAAGTAACRGSHRTRRRSRGSGSAPASQRAVAHHVGRGTLGIGAGCFGRRGAPPLPERAVYRNPCPDTDVEEPPRWVRDAPPRWHPAWLRAA